MQRIQKELLPSVFVAAFAITVAASAFAFTGMVYNPAPVAMPPVSYNSLYIYASLVVIAIVASLSWLAKRVHSTWLRTIIILSIALVCVLPGMIMLIVKPGICIDGTGMSQQQVLYDCEIPLLFSQYSPWVYLCLLLSVPFWVRGIVLVWRQGRPRRLSGSELVK